MDHSLLLWTLGGIAFGCFVLGPIIGGPGDLFGQFVGAAIGVAIGVVVGIIMAPGKP